MTSTFKVIRTIGWMEIGPVRAKYNIQFNIQLIQS